MEERYNFKIFKYFPKEVIFEGEKTFTQARKFMDESATFERFVCFEVFNDLMNRWEKFDDKYIGNRQVLSKDVLYIIDLDYRNMWKAKN